MDATSGNKNNVKRPVRSQRHGSKPDGSLLPPRAAGSESRKLEDRSRHQFGYVLQKEDE